MKENIDIFVLCVLLKFYMSKGFCFSATNKSLSLVKATPPEDKYLKLCLLGNRKALLSQIQKIMKAKIQSAEVLSKDGF